MIYITVHLCLCTHTINNVLINMGLTLLQPRVRRGPGDGEASPMATYPHQYHAHMFGCTLLSD